MLTRNIPSSSEALPVIGLGTWQTFDVDASRYASLKDVLIAMHKAGARLIDSSPMYGCAEEVVGNVTAAMPEQNDFFYATKVWTQGAEAGKKQIKNSYRLMKREVMDLVQIHNLLDWQTHLSYLRKLKDEGKLRYIGITHYLDGSHEALANVIRKESVDFVQFNYSVLSRHAEKFLLPLCAERGVATLINRPFGEGSLFRKVADKPLPPWAAELGIDNWGAYFLKFILSHPAVTCVIPATGNVNHAMQNLQAGEGSLPDQDTRQKMAAYIEAL
ncbi:aldo/keto reductase [Flavisolibacter ginsenosidimutans]|uniref:Aldo/keto reductase n=1 Tax=Flavisolibacter ginsenosidimutans TaxID=661481 RepID=A0A5B8UF89_9BACT|nr:aldo/keto reductase [Flavisolibacter ginsenosidimutans]QEC54799.1 aldo/keto reductase [Flavisolibacter ginsenosidimutans]